MAGKKSKAPTSSLGVVPTTATINDLRVYQNSLNAQYGYRNGQPIDKTDYRIGSKRWVRQAVAQPVNMNKFVYASFSVTNPTTGIIYRVPEMTVIGFSQAELNLFENHIKSLKDPNLAGQNAKYLSNLNSYSFYDAVDGNTYQLPSPYGLLFVRSDLARTDLPAGAEFTTDQANKLGIVVLKDLISNGGTGKAEFLSSIVHEPIHFLYVHTFQNVFTADGLIPLVGQIAANPGLLTVNEIKASKVYGTTYDYLKANSNTLGLSVKDVETLQKTFVANAAKTYNKYYAYSYAETFASVKAGIQINPGTPNVPLSKDQLQALTKLSFTIEQAVTTTDATGKIVYVRVPVKDKGKIVKRADGTVIDEVDTRTKSGKILIYKEPAGLTTKAQKDAAKGDINNYTLNPELDTKWVRDIRSEYKRITTEIANIRNSNLDAATKARLEREILNDAAKKLINDNPDLFQVSSRKDNFLEEVYGGLTGALTDIDGAQIGLALGSVLGKRITSNPFGQVVASGVLSTALGAIGEALDGGPKSTSLLANGLDGLLDETFENIKSAGVGALSSYLTAQLLNALGVKGLAGELGNTFGSAALSQIMSNVIKLAQGVKTVEETGEKLTAFSGINATFVASIAASYLGGKLASAIKTFDSVGGQIGSAVGAAYGSYVAGAILAGGPITVAAVVVAVIAVAFWQLVGGLIGSIFGGTPRSGADVAWDESKNQFVVSNVYARQGGSKDTARQMADAVGSGLNSVLSAFEGALLDAKAIQSGNYGMRNKDYVYRPKHTQDKSAITARFTGKDGAQKLIDHGTYLGLNSMLGQMVGGDIYVKRALFASLANAGGNPNSNAAGAAGNFTLEATLGDVSIARDYSSYLANRTEIDALISDQPNSSFSGGWLITFARAVELGLNKRSKTDWAGGYRVFLDEVLDGRVDGSILAASALEAGIDTTTGARFWSVFDQDGDVDGFVEDSIDVDSVTSIEGAQGIDVIDLRTARLSNQIGYTVNGHLNNDIAVTGEDFTGQTNSLITFTASGAGSLRQGATVSGLTDATASEAAEKFLGQLSNGTGVSIIGGAAEATIVDGTAAKPTLLVGRSYALEGAVGGPQEYATFRLSLSKASTSAVTLSLATAAVNGTAGTDYNANIEVSTDGGLTWGAASPNPSATFAAGVTQLFARVAVTADNGTGPDGKPTGVEGNERFSLTATVAAGDTTKVANTPDATTTLVAVLGIGTIVDHSVGTTPLAWIDSVVADEASGSVTFSIARSKAGTAATLNFSTADTKELVIDVAATVDAGDGDDIVYASNLGDNVFGGAGNDKLYGGRLDDWLLGGDGNDVLNAGSDGAGTLGGDGNYLNGGAGDDLLIGREGSDWLEGGDGTDTLEGGDGGDILAGGGGTGDVLRGGRGDDQYIFRTGDANDIVRDESGLSVEQVVRQSFFARPNAEINGAGGLVERAVSGDLFELGSGLNNWSGGGVQTSSTGVAAGGEDALVFGAGIGLEDLKISKSVDGKDLIIELWPEGVFGGDRMTLTDWFGSFNKIETLRFADGNEVRIADFDTFTLGSEGNDTIIGTAGNDFVHAGAGNDLVYLLSGNDFGNGGLGDDTVSGDSGNDIVIGSDGNDIVIGGFGQDSVSGGRGDDKVTGDEGNDIVAGGAGNDEVIGGAGSDVFKFQRGDGRDVFIDALTDTWELVWVSGTGFSAGYTLGNDGTITHNTAGVIYNGTGWNARIRYDMEQGKLWRHTPASADAIVANSGGDMIEFGLGIDINDIQFQSANAGKDLVIGIEPAGGGAGLFNSLGDQITLKEWGAAGTAAAKGSIEKFVFFNTGAVNVGAMTLAGGTDGNDSVTGHATAENWLTGGAGDDTLTGGSANDILNGNAGQDRLIGLGGSDVLLGGADNDVLIGGAGGTRDGNTSAGDILIGGDGIDTASYETATAGVTASLSGLTANAGDAAGDLYQGVESLRGSDHADILEGDEFENELIGGKGNDGLRGAGGDDFYVFGRGDGADIIVDQLVAEETLIVAQDSASPTGPALVANLQPPYVSSVQLVDRTGATHQFEHIVTNSESGEVIYRKEFAGAIGAGIGSLGYYDEGYQGGLTSPTTLDADGWVKNDDATETTPATTRFIVTGSKVHFVSSYAGAGSDTILFEDYTGNAGVTGDATIALSDLTFAFSGNDLVITITANGAGGGSVTLKNFKTASGFNTAQAIETLQFSDGSSVNLAGLIFNPTTGALLAASTDTLAAPVNDFIVTNATTAATGNFGNDTLVGGAANNNLQGGDGDDFLVGGMGADTLAGGAGIDTVSYAGSDATGGVNINLSITTAQATVTGSESTGDLISGVENVVGSQFIDTLTGSDGDNVLRGLRGDDILVGGGTYSTAVSSTFGTGNDVLIGDDGNDTLRGGAGEDNLDGGTGNDVLEGGSERDVLAGGDGNDILRGDSTNTSATAESADYTGNLLATGSAANGVLVNASFEDSGDVPGGSNNNDVTQSYGLTSVDLPGWTITGPATVPPAQLFTAASGVTGLTGARALNLDVGVAGVTFQQEVRNLQAGEVLTLNYAAAVRSVGATGGFEILWNGVVVPHTPNTTTVALTAAAPLKLTAKAGTNTLSFRATGTADGQGSVIDNVRLTRSDDQLIGGAGSDRLLGGGGNDVLLGGDGDDLASINVTAGAGTTSQTFAAGLYGGAGDDILDGGAGNDTLDGGAGNDSYLLRAAYGTDAITVSGGQDDVVFDEIAHDQLWFRQVGTDLEISAIGLGTTALVKNWFTSAAGEPNKARRIVAFDKALARSDVAALVTAMAAVSTTVPSSWPSAPTQAFTDALAARWQDNASYVDRAVITGTTGNDSGATALTSNPILIGAARYEGLAGVDTIDATRLNPDGSEQALDDIIIGGAGVDTMSGGAGNDQFLFDTDGSYDVIAGGTGTDVLKATIAGARINITSMTGIEEISGDGFANVQVYNKAVTSGTATLDLSAVTLTNIAQINGNNTAAVIETITGSAGDDIIFSLAGVDTVFGGLGNDVIRGGAGNDILDGGDGIDTYDGSDVTLAGTINISNPASGSHVATGTGATTDTLKNFENAIGGTNVDTMIGSTGANRLEGRGGNDDISGGDGDDVLVGGVGGDTLRGGAGTDTASYEGSTVGVTVNLATHIIGSAGATGGDAAADKLDAIENLTGSGQNDSLTGNGGDNILKGGLGNDTLSGGAGGDTAVFSGSFSDYVYNAGAGTVTDALTTDGNDGVDTLNSIEFLQFSDVRISLGIDPNNGPRLGKPAMADQLWDDSAAKSYQIPGTAFYDLDLADGMTFTATLADGSALPSWLLFNATTRTFSGTPPVGSIGTVLEILVTATDVPAAGQSAPLSVSDTLLLTVTEAAGVQLNAAAGVPLAGTFRRETMMGTTGNDIFLGSLGADRIEGLASTPPGGDRVDYSGSDASVTVDLAAGTASGGHAEGDTLLSIEEATGSAFDDSLSGTGGGDKLYGGDGADSISGRGGDDLIKGGAGADTLSGGDGIDSIHARALADGSLEDSVDGGKGVDTLYLGESAHGAIIDISASSRNPVSIEHVTGSDHADTIGGNEYANILSGGLGNDTISGDYGADTLHGDGGNDIVQGGEGNDSVYGDDGDDRLSGGLGADTLYGGIGNDTLDYRSSSVGVSANLATNAGSGGDAQGDIYADGTIENVDGSDFADTLTGNGAANVLKGFGGDDIFVGGAGNDSFDGGSGVDRIIYTGNRSAYTINFAAKTITHSGSDGVDSFEGIEFIQFADQTVNNSNQAPTVTGGLSNQSTHDNANFSYVIPTTAFADADGPQAEPYKGLSFTAALVGGGALPAWLTFNPATKTFSYAGTGAAIGSSTNVRVTASDGQASVTADFTISFTEGPGATITGTANGETINGTFRAEAINALDGNDTVNGSAGADAIDGGNGTDIVSYASSNAGITITIGGSAGIGGDAQGDTLVNVEDVIGSAFVDNITGSAGANIVDSGAGNDTIFGGDGNDTLAGGAGDDIIRGEAGDDNMLGGSGADVFDGGTGSDYANYYYSAMRTGNDPVTVGVTADLASAGLNTGFAAGDSYVSIENLYGTAFADTLRGDAGNNVLQGDGGADSLWGRSGNDTLYGQAGDDSVLGEAGTDALYGGDGNDYLYGGSGGDTLDGGAGVDWLSYRFTDGGAEAMLGVSVDLSTGVVSGGDAAGDVIVLGSFEALEGTQVADTLRGSANGDSVQGNGGDDLIQGLGGNDALYGWTGNDTIEGGDGDDGLHGQDGNDVLVGGLGVDTLNGHIGNDRLVGGVGTDVLDGGAGVDTIDYRASSLGVIINLTTGTLAGGDAAGDTIAAGTIENVDGSDLADTITGSAADNVLQGFVGDDFLIGGLGADTLGGGDGNDTLFGDEGNDLLQGGAGGDNILGGLGADSHDGGAGSDYANYYYSSYGTEAATGVTANLANAGLNTGIAAGDTYTSIENLYGTTQADMLTGDAADNVIQGAGGADTIYGGAGNDLVLADADGLHGTSGADTVYGEAGLDTLYGGAGNDMLDGGTEADSLYGEVGDDTLYGRSGNDSLQGGAGTDFIYGEDGNDTVDGGTEVDHLFGGAGVDIVNGDDGDDRLHGEAGADTLSGGVGNDYLYGGSGGDVLNGGAGGTDYATYYYTDGGANNVTGVTVDVSNIAGGSLANNSNDALGDSYVDLEGIIGSQGNDVIRAGGTMTTVYGMEGNDTISGSTANDWFVGGTGVDNLHGAGGNDYLDGGDGNDIMMGAAANDTLVGRLGDDTLNGGAGADTLDGGDGLDTAGYYLLDELGTVTPTGVTADLSNSANNSGVAAGDTYTSIEHLYGTAHADILRGDANANTLTGAEGNDALEGNAGNDILVGGDGNDTLIGGAGADNLSGGAGIDTISYAAAAAGANFNTATAIGGVTVGATTIATAVTRTMNGVFVHLGTTAPTDGIRAKNSDAAGDTFAAPIDIEKVIGSANADEITGSDANSEVVGGAGDDVIYGGAGNDILDGGAGNDFIFGQAGIDMIYGGDGDDRLFGEGDPDTLYGGAGNDILDAGDAGDMLYGDGGNDIMIGGLGDDQYWLTRTSGSDTIYNYSSTTTFDDVVQYSPDIQKANLWFTKVGKDLKVKVIKATAAETATSSEVTIKDWFVNATAGDFTNTGVQYVLRMFIAGQSTATTVDSLSQLLNIMKDIVEPASFDALSGTQQTAINNAWILNTPPTIVAVAGNPTTLNEDGTAVLYFDVADNGQTPLASISIQQGQSGAVQIDSISTVVGNEGRRMVTVRGAPNASGAGSITLTATDSVFNSTPLVVPLTVTAVADGVTLTVPGAVSGNNGTAISLAGVATTLLDNDGSEVVHAIRIVNVPVGVTIASGASTFTASAGNLVVDITTWNKSTLTVTAPAGSNADFTLQFEATSRETSNGAISAANVKTVNVAINGAPSVSSAASASVAENAAANTVLATLTATDPDSNFSGFSLIGAPAFITLSGSQLILSSASLNYEAATSYSFTVRATDAGGLTGDQAFTLNVTNVNEAPTNTSPGAASVAENAGGGTVLATLSATDPENNVSGYSLIGAPAFITVSGTSLILSTASLNYEAAASYNFTIRASDAGGLTSDKAFTLNVTNVNEAPTITSASSASIAESTGGGIVVRALTATDPEGTAPTWSIVSGSALFAISGSNLVTAAGASFNFEATTSYALTLRATDPGGLTHDQAFTVSITNVNEAPSTPTTSNANVTVNENLGAHFTGVTVSASDPDAGDVVSYRFSDSGTAVSGNGLFEIRNTNQLWAVAPLNYEAVTSYALGIQAFANGQLSGTLSQTVTVGNVNEAPTNTSPGSNTLAENAAAGTLVATLAATDPENNVTGYSLIGAPAFLTISGSSLTLASASLNFEAATSYAFTIRASDAGGLVSDKAFTLNVSNVNEAPTNTTATSASLAENAGAGTPIVNLTATDPEGTAPTWSLIGAPGFVSIVGTQLQLNSASLNFEAATSHSFTIRATDPGGLVSDTAFTLNVTNINETPHSIVDADGALGGAVNEGTGGYTGVQVQASDPEGAGTLSYSITGGNASGWFSINATNGQIFASAAIDRESGHVSGGQITLSVTATDSGGLSVSRGDVSVVINDVNETPYFTSGASAAVSEAVAGATYIATISTADFDADGVAFGEAGHVLYIYSGDTSKFQLVATGSPNVKYLYTQPGVVLDYETATSHALQFRVYDNSGNGGWSDAYQNFTVNVGPVNEAPTITSSASATVGENAGAGTVIATLAATDPEGTAVTWGLALGAPTFLSMSGNQLVLNTASLNYEATTSYAFSVVASDGVSSTAQGFTLNVSNVNEAPSGPSAPATGSIAENATGYAGITFSGAVDPDGDSVQYVFADSSTVSGQFSIIANNQLHVNAGFNYEVQTSASTTVYAYANGQRSAAGVTATVNIGNVDDNLPVAGGITNQGATFAENASNNPSPNPPGSVIATASATDIDGDGIVWSIVGGNPTGALGINTSNGELFIANGFNYELLNPAYANSLAPNDPAFSFSITVRAAQANNSGRFVDQTLNLQITDISEIEPIWTFVDQVGFGVTIDIGNGFFFEKERTGGGGGPAGQGPGPDMFWRIVHYPGGVRTLVAEKYNNLYLGPQWDIVNPGYQWGGPSWVNGSVFLRSLPPIVLDLNDDGVITSTLTAAFDIDGNGAKDKTGWISSGDAFLALDRDGNGAIDKGVEISFLNDKPGAKTDLEGLQAYDSNTDGVFDAKDARFGEFLVWQDANSDGVSQSAELRSLAEAGIASINLVGTPETPSDEGGVAVLATSTFTRADGTIGKVGDVALRWEEIALASAAAASSEKTAHAVTDSDAALPTPLAFDADGNGVIDPATEVAITVAAASEFDSNGDGLINASDARYFDLRLWNDANKNGRAEPQELVGLAVSATPTLDLAALAAAPPAEEGTDDGTPDTPAITPPPALDYIATSFDRTAGKYLLEARGGALFVAMKKADAVVDPRAGSLSGATIIDFRGKSVGMLAPIVLDLDGDGLDLVGRKKSQAAFDMDGDGTLDDTGWIGKGDGLLVIDRNNDGLITGASELSFLIEKPGAKSDLEALAVLDSNRDGKIDATDTRFGELEVWVDADRDGTTDAGELRTLADLGIKEIGLAGRSTDMKAKPGKNLVLATSSFTRTDGTTGTVGDVAFAFNPSSKAGNQASDDSASDSSLSDDMQLESLRTGMLSGFQIPQEVAVQAAAEASREDLQIAQMTQAMASFGATSGESDLGRDRLAQNALDWFGASGA